MTTVPFRETESQLVADRLLAAMDTIRRTLRRAGGRPEELSALSGAQLELVRLVHRRPGISIAEAAEELRVAPNTVSTLVRQLAAASVLLRRVDEVDRRVGRLELSREMNRTFGAWRDRRAVVVGAALERLGSDERARLLDALPALAQVAAEIQRGVTAR